MGEKCDCVNCHTAELVQDWTDEDCEECKALFFRFFKPRPEVEKP